MPFLYRGGELIRPAMVERENVIAKPEMLGAVNIPKLDYFFSYRAWRPDMKSVTRDWLRAPVASVGTAPTGNQVERVVAMTRLPGIAVRPHVDQVPCRCRKSMPRCRLGECWIANHTTTRGIQTNESRNTVGIFHLEKRLAKLNQGKFSFSQQHIVDTLLEIFSGTIGCIGTMRDDRSPEGTPSIRHRPRHLPHSGQTHFRQKIEVVLINDHNPRFMSLEVLRKCHGVLEHGVEDRYR